MSLSHLNFEFRICFEFRDSDFEFLYYVQFSQTNLRSQVLSRY